MWINKEFSADQYLFLEVHISAEMRPSFIANQENCGAYFSTIHAKKVLHRIQTDLMICVTETVTSIYSFVTFQADNAQMPICCAGQAPTYVIRPISLLGFMQLANQQEVMVMWVTQTKSLVPWYQTNTCYYKYCFNQCLLDF